ncbi:MAG: endonuclease/exonuclease/phosphatase family protein [Planctomycetota bacterium]
MSPTRLSQRLSSPLLSIALALLSAPHAAAQDDTLRIGSWNLEFLGDPGQHRTVYLDNGGREQLPPRTDDDLRRIGALVRELGVSMLAIQEICGEQAARDLAAAIGPTWRDVLGTTGGWNDGATFQSLGFVYDGARLELLWAEELLDFPRERDDLPIFHRVPVTACFRDRVTGIDFRAVTVHLKASMKPADLQKRKLEATVLRDWIVLLQATPGEDQDLVVLGDFNSTYGTDPQQVLEQAGVLRYLPQRVAEPTIMHFAEPIDQVAVAPAFTEVDPATFDAHGEAAAADPRAWRKTYSDHFPVTVTLRASADDDPDAAFSRGAAEHRLPVALRAGEPAAATTVRAEATAPRAATTIATGARVEVSVLEIGTVRGELLEPLGDWVVVLCDSTGSVRAFPAVRVVQVRVAR